MWYKYQYWYSSICWAGLGQIHSVVLQSSWRPQLAKNEDSELRGIVPIYIQTKAPKKWAKQPIHPKQGLDSETLQNRGLIRALDSSKAELIRIHFEELFFLSCSPATEPELSSGAIFPPTYRGKRSQSKLAIAATWRFENKGRTQNSNQIKIFRGFGY